MTAPLPPLVQPGPPLTPDERARYSRHLLMPEIGEIGQRRLRAARVAVIGAGGLGAPVLQYLAAAGVGRIGIVDDDVVDLTNLQRQVIHGHADVGRAKVDSAADGVRAIDPGVDVVTHRVRLTAQNADLLGGYDLVIDGADNFPTRYLVNDTCVRLGLPEVWGSVLRFDAQVSVFWGRPPVGIEPIQLRDVFPEPPPEGAVPSCASAGVLGALCGQVGALMATEAIKVITGVGRPALGRILVLDALAGSWRTVPVRSAGSAPAATQGGRAGREHAASPGVVREIDPAAAAEMLRSGAVTLLDVREPVERDLAVIAADQLAIPLAELPVRLDEVPDGRPVLAYCHLGIRSRVAARYLNEAGRDAVNLTGGIEAWAQDVDPAVPRY